MVKQINVDKLEISSNGEITKKRNTIKHSKENALEVHEQKELINCIKELPNGDLTKERYRVLVALIMEAGLRISEAIQTRYSWINETEDGITLNIPKKDRDLRNMKRDWIPKTEAGAREVIFINDRVGVMVKSFMLNNKYGLGFSRQRAGQIVKQLGIAINKPLLHPHALRSTYANNLIYKGVNASTLMYYMGWVRLDTAMNYIKGSKIAARKDLLDRVKEDTKET